MVHDVDVQVEQKEMFRRYRWLGLLVLGFVLLFLVRWLQQSFWLAQVPGQVEYGWIGLLWPFAVETGLCIGVVLLGVAVSCVRETDRIAERILGTLFRSTYFLIGPAAKLEQR
jgi:hypothetical protein